MIKVAPSILSADFYNLEREIDAIVRSGADYLHFDVMDGHFVPNISYGPVVLDSLKGKSSLVMDVHLMISDPDKYIPAFAKAGADIISFHAEAVSDYVKTCDIIKDAGVKPAIVLNPDTPVSRIADILPVVDMVLLMSVFPGFGGQKFISSVLGKSRELVILKKKNDYKYLIEIDGGVNTENATEIKEAGVDILVAGSAFFKSSDKKKFVEQLKF